MRRDPDLVLLHVGDEPAYDAGHIPGARYVALSDISVSDRSDGGLTLEMPPAADLRDHLAALGISDTSRIVVYQSEDQWIAVHARDVHARLRRPWQSGVAARWRHGGLGASGQRLSTDAAGRAKTGTLSAHDLEPIVVDADFVQSHLTTPGPSLSTRALPAFYDGLQTGGSARRRAQDRPHRRRAQRAVRRSSTTTDVRCSRRTKWRRFHAAGVKPGDTVIGYCHIGQQATAMLFGARLLGHPVLLYDGSFEDWSRHDGYPVDNPTRKAPK